MRRRDNEYRIYIYRSMYRCIYRLLKDGRVLVTRIGPRDNVYSEGGYVRLKPAPRNQ